MSQVQSVNEVGRMRVFRVAFFYSMTDVPIACRIPTIKLTQITHMDVLFGTTYFWARVQRS